MGNPRWIRIVVSMVAAPVATEIRTVPYFLVLLRRGENHDAAAEHYPAHVRFVGTMEAANTVLLGGSFGSPIDGAEGAYLLHVASRTEAEDVASQDPLVKARVCEAKIVEWKLVGVCRGAIDTAFGDEG
jgi:uncharacterized protein YciI